MEDDRDREPTVTFRIGEQKAVNVSNVGRDQVVHGSLSGQANFGVADAIESVETIKLILADLDLPTAEHAAATEALDKAKEELTKPSVDKKSVAAHVERATDILQRCGALISAGGAVVQPLYKLALWLGAHGLPLLALLPL